MMSKGDRAEFSGGEGMSEWRECKLGEQINLKRGYDLPNRLRQDGAIPIYSSSGITGFHSEKMCEAPGVITGRYGTIGKIFFSSTHYWPLNTTLYIQDFKGNDELFFYYFLQQLDWEKYSDKSAVPGINRNDVHQEDIVIPSLLEQKAIASILSSLDDKIDLLHRQNRTLEAISETLFRQWFIEEAQEDWEQFSLSDICSGITKGTTPTTLGHQFTESGINFIKAESITDEGDFVAHKFAKISKETHQSLKRSIVQNGDLLCSIAGTIGRIAIVDNSILPANTNQAVAIIRANREKCSPEFIYLFLKSSMFKELMDGKVVHAVQPNLSLGEIGSTTLQLPNLNILNEFQEMIYPIFHKKSQNTLQIRILEKLRDNLLPKLMSGEVRVEI
ncbi:restriction endonuclease subunit S [Altericista sp. CCNU0014]|uniref:restriction endonuclease subunit S n=1 Tax=Altericista sp. CCNU0014 TaxID=3082949 RepID=UPI00384CB1F0